MTLSARETRTFWLDGAIVAGGEAAIHPMAHALHYGTGVFEGIRAYETARGAAIFRMREHIERLFASAAAYGLAIPYTVDELCAATVDVVRASGQHSAYIRPLAFFGDGPIVLHPKGANRTQTLIAVLALPPIHAAKRVRTTISPILKTPSRALPSTVKGSGHYTNSVLAVQEAVARGFDEAIMLNDRGEIAEGPGENVFIVQNGAIRTNDASADVLLGITRDSVLQIAEAEGIPTAVGPIAREALLAADEAFFTGTAAEVVPIDSVDAHRFPSASPVTDRLRAIYGAAIHGNDGRFSRWLTFTDAT